MSFGLAEIETVLPQHFKFVQFTLSYEVVHVLNHEGVVFLYQFLLQISDAAFGWFEQFVEGCFSCEGLVNNREDVLVPLNLLCEFDEIDFAAFNKLQITVVVDTKQSYHPQLILQFNYFIRLLSGAETMDHHHQFVCDLLEEVAVEDLLAKDSIGLLFRSGSVR